MSRIAVHFPSAAYANQLVAGVPCAARAVHYLVREGEVNPGATVAFVIEENGQLTPFCRSELSRLAPEIDWTLEHESEDDATIEAAEILASICGGQGQAPSLAHASKAIFAATGKPTDGIVSRFLNRPISQAISRQLLRSQHIRPIHATLLAALIGIVMAVFLFACGPQGLLPAAILFQAASIIDGVDGEIARATFRSSKSGASLDTATDAATNFAFVGGLAFNLWQQGGTYAPLIGLAGLALLALGLSLIGALSVRAGKGLSFDAIKSDVHAGGSSVMLVLAKLTSRDFYVLALAVMVALGFGAAALITFGIAAAAWFLFVLGKLANR